MPRETVRNEGTIYEYIGLTLAEVEARELAKGSDGKRVIDARQDDTCLFHADRIRCRLGSGGRVADARVG